MKRITRIFLRLYALLTALYPVSFRKEFAFEMQAVLREKLTETQRRGVWDVFPVFLGELCDLPRAVILEYWFVFWNRFGSNLMSQFTEDKSWKIEPRGEAILASLPPLLFGAGIGLGALVIWEPWYIVPPWRMWTGLSIILLPAFVISIGGFLAILKRLPVWGYTWAGGAVMGFAALVKILAEESADFGITLPTPALEIGLVLAVLVGILAIVIRSAWRGWRQAGLTSLGFASIAGMGTFSMATAAPLNRYDLALLAAPVGLAMSILIYLYVSGRDSGRIAAIFGYELINTVVLLIIVGAWNFPPNNPSPTIPFLVLLTGALIIGPAAGLMGKPLRKIMPNL